MPWPEGATPILEIETHLHNEPESAARFVTWIPWDSGFRGSGLRVGDLVVGHDDVRYTLQTVETHEAVGDVNFSRYLDRIKAKPDDPLILTVLRKDQELRITGRVGGHRSYRNAEDKRILGENGPLDWEKDGFDYTWDAWYRQFVPDAKSCMSGWDHFVGTNTKGLAEHLPSFAARIEFLEQKYPGPFAQAVRDDYEAMKKGVAGEPRSLTEADLAYRNLGDVRAAQASAAADAAFDAFLAEVTKDLLLNPPSAPDAFAEDTRPLHGRTVRLPELSRQQILFETRRSWWWSGSGQGGYLLDRSSAAMKRLYAGMGDYTEKVDPFFRDHKVVFVGVIQPEPALVSDTLRRITVSGLRVEPLAGLVSNTSQSDRRLFVDLRPGRMDEPFAGAAALATGIKKPELRDDLGPGDVLLTAFEALKMGDMATWLKCYATWMVRGWYGKGESYQYVDRTCQVMSPGQSANSAWDQARKRLMDDLYAVEVDRVTPVRVVYEAAAQPDGSTRAMEAGAPQRVEEVLVYLNHIGKVNGEFRTFAGSMLRRRWELQRLDKGPWRITSTQSI